MMLLNVNKVSINYGFSDLLKDVSFGLNEGECISFVGPNGCGKSTLIRIIAGEESCKSGNVSIKKGAKISYLKQTIDEFEQRTSRDYMLDAFKEVNSVKKDIIKYEKKMEKYSDEKDIEKYCLLINKYNDLGGYTIDSKVSEICDGLRISQKLLNQSFSVLSGGEKTLVQLAKCLLENPDIFLLDEPTNNLDIERIEWLESYIKKFKGGIVIVSHDRYFLNKMSDKILDLSDSSSKLYNMRYDLYIKEKEIEFKRQMIDYKVQQQQIKKYEQEIIYFLQKANQTKSSTMYDRVKQLREKVEKIKNYGVKKPLPDNKIKMSFDCVNKKSKTVFSIENLSVKKKDGIFILNNVSVSIKYGDRIALIGNNGSGKTTFINTILGNTSLDTSGDIIVGPSTKIGYLPQNILFDEPKFNVLDYFSKEACKDIETSRRILSIFHFDKNSVMKRIDNLSGGEKIRLKLSVLLQQSVNCLIFDEPTNHIDMETKEVLEDAIESFNGTFIFVSHDRYFINKFANKLLAFKDNSFTLYYGNYDYYKEKLK